MATNIGRVEFIVDLDGDKIPAQARRLGRQIAAAGTDAGEDFGDNFDSAFDRSLTGIGARAATAMRKAGRLGGESFADDVESALKSRSRSISKSLAGVIIDEKALAKSFESFTTTADALNHYDTELRALGEDVDKYTPTLLAAAQAEDERRASLEKSTEAMRLIAVEQEKLNAQVDRLQRLSRDTTAIERAATQQRASYAQVTADMRKEMEGLHALQVVSLTDVQRHSDALEKSVQILEQRDKDAAKAAQNELDRIDRRDKADARIARNDAQRARDRLDRIARQTEAEEKSAASAEANERRRSIASLKAQASFDAAIKKEEEGNDTHERTAGVLDKISGSFRRMDGTVKAVIVSILFAADEVAVLGSALGAGVIALGGALSAVAVGGIGIVSLFAKLNNELDELPVALRPAAQGFQELGKAMSDIGQAIAVAAVGNIGEGFAVIERNARNLIPSLSGVGHVLGGLIDDFGQATRKGTAAFKEIDGAIINGTGNFDALSRTAGELGVALLRSFNRAQPLVEDLLGWVDKLVERFDDFTQSAGFDEWIRNAQTTFGAFGKLLDAVGRGLNDLVTPASVKRTEDFLTNVTDFIPHLTTLLDAMGDFDLFGLAAQALAEFSEALSPIAGPAAELATVLNEVLSEAITQLAGVATTIAPALAAIVDGFANWIGAMDPGTVAIMAGAVATLAVSIGAMNAVIGVSAALKWFQTFSVHAGKLGPAAGLAAKGITGVVKAAGTIGIAVTAVGLLGSAFKALTGAADMVAPGIEQVTRSLNAGGGINSAFVNGAEGVDTFSEAVKQVAGPDLADGLKRFNSSLGGLVGIRTPVNDAADSIKALDASIASMVAKGDTEKAAQAFNDAALAANAVGVPYKELKKLFPEYAEALAGANNATDDAVSGFDEIATQSGITLRSIEDLADAISGFGDTQLSANAAQREFAASIDAVTQSVTENGTAWGVSTEEGRANMEAIDGIAEASLKSAQAIKENTGSQELANAAIGEGRTKLIEQLAQFGITGTAAEEYADSVGLAADGNGELQEKTRSSHADLVNQLEQFGLNAADAELYATKLEEVPADIPTTIALLGTDDAIKDAGAVKAAIDAVKSKTVTLTINTKNIGQSGNQIYTIKGGGSFEARGSIATAPKLSVWGEAGPEAMVPLNRPLHQVDPSVRALSAFAQGLPLPGGGGFGGNAASSTSRVVNVSPGAIVIQGDRAPEATATNVVNRLAQRIAG